MEKLKTITNWLAQIKETEGTSFNADEEAIANFLHQKEENASTLAIKLLSIFGGCFASVIFLGFLGIIGLYEFEWGMLIIGGLLIISSVILNRLFNQLIIDTFSITIFVIGFCLQIGGSLGMDLNENVVAIGTATIAFLVLIVNKNFILSFLSILIINAAAIFLLFNQEFYDGIHLFVLVNLSLLVSTYIFEARILAWRNFLSNNYTVIRAASLFALWFGLAVLAVASKMSLPVTVHYNYLTSAVMMVMTMYLLRIILAINDVQQPSFRILVYILILAILSTVALSPSIITALLILLWSFLVNYKTGMVTGIIALVYFISQFYYDLNFTLLTKSILLMSSGLIFILLYVLMTKKMIVDEKI